MIELTNSELGGQHAGAIRLLLFGGLLLLVALLLPRGILPQLARLSSGDGPRSARRARALADGAGARVAGARDRVASCG